MPGSSVIISSVVGSSVVGLAVVKSLVDVTPILIDALFNHTSCFYTTRPPKINSGNEMKLVFQNLTLTNSGWRELEIDQSKFLGTMEMENCDSQDSTCESFYSSDIFMKNRTTWYQQERFDVTDQFQPKLDNGICNLTDFSDLRIMFFSKNDGISEKSGVPENNFLNLAGAYIIQKT